MILRPGVQLALTVVLSALAGSAPLAFGQRPPDSENLPVRIAIEVLADTGRRPNEICILAWDCLDYDTQIDDSGASQKLAVLVHDMPKVARTGCRLPTQ